MEDTQTRLDHDEEHCTLCQKYAHTVVATSEEHAAYRRALRGMGFQTDTMHNYDVAGVIGLIETTRENNS